MIRQLCRPGIIVPSRGVQRPGWPYTLNRDSLQAQGLSMSLLLNVNSGYLDQNGIALTPSGAPSWANDPVFGTVLNFNGTDAYLTSTNPAYGLPGAFTLSAWALQPSSPAGWTIVSEDYGGDTAVQYMLCTRNGPSGGTFGFYNSNWQQCIDDSATPNVWELVVGTWDLTTLRFYRNGKFLTSTTPGVTQATQFTRIYIGRR